MSRTHRRCASTCAPSDSPRAIGSSSLRGMKPRASSSVARSASSLAAALAVASPWIARAGAAIEWGATRATASVRTRLMVRRPAIDARRIAPPPLSSGGTEKRTPASAHHSPRSGSSGQQPPLCEDAPRAGGFAIGFRAAIGATKWCRFLDGRTPRVLVERPPRPTPERTPSTRPSDPHGNLRLRMVRGLYHSART